jgi:hypothetical protein
MNTVEEVWKDIPDYEGLYQVSNLGRVKSLERKCAVKNGVRTVREKILKTSLNRVRKYLYVSLYTEQNDIKFNIHQLVAMAFLGHKPDGTQKIVVDHINNIITDNRLENLQLITNRENSTKDQKGGTSKYVGVSWNKQNKRWTAQIRVFGELKYLGAFKNEYDAHLAYQKALKEHLESSK